MTEKELTDDELEAYFENFDFDAAISHGRDPIFALHAAAQFRREAEERIRGIVAEARESGATWTQIGDALGASHQAAMKRYKRSARVERG